MNTPTPHEIRLADGSPAYRCRVCRTEDKLHWFNDTSCPVCSKSGCIEMLQLEWQHALEEMNEEHDE